MANAENSPPQPVIAHVHATFLPPTEHWICRLLSHVPGFRHIAVAERVAAPGCSHVTHVPHGAELIAETRYHPHRLPRAFALARLAVAGGIPRMALRRLRASGQRVNLVHAHFGDVAWHWRSLAPRLGVPLVVSFYGYDFTALPRRSGAWMSRIAYVLDAADALVAEAPHAAAQLVALGADPGKVHVVNLGTTTVAFDLPPQPSTANHLLQVATLTPKKGQALTIAAFAKIAQEFPDATLTLVGGLGEAAYAKTVLDAVARLGARVRHLDFVPPDALEAHFRSATAFVQPSVYGPNGDSEGGAPIAILDAQATGLPAIVSDHCDLPFVTAPLGWNEPVPQGDIAALAARMRLALARSPAQRIADGDAAYRFVRDRFDVRIWGARLTEVYCSLL